MIVIAFHGLTTIDGFVFFVHIHVPYHVFNVISGAITVHHVACEAQLYVHVIIHESPVFQILVTHTHVPYVIFRVISSDLVIAYHISHEIDSYNVNNLVHVL